MNRHRIYIAATIGITAAYSINLGANSFTSFDAQRIATKISSNSVITATNAQRLTEFAHIPPLSPDNTLENPVWSQDGSKLAVTSLNSIAIFGVNNFDKPQQLITQDDPVNIEFSPDSRLLISINGNPADRSVHVFDVETGNEVYALQEKASSFPSPQVSPDGKLLAVQRLDTGAIDLFELSTGKHEVSLPREQDFFTFGLDNTIATIEHTEEAFINTVWIWDVSTGQKIRSLERNSNPTSIAASPETGLFAISYDDHTIILWNAQTGAIRQTIESGYGPEGQAIVLLFSRDSTLLAGIGPGTIYLWKLRDNNVIAQFDNINPDMNGGLFNQDGSLLVYWDYINGGDKSFSGNLTRIWSINDNKELITLKDARDPQFSPDGSMLATWGDGITIWTVQ